MESGCAEQTLTAGIFYLCGMKFYDTHTHSHFSPDARMSMEEGVRQAAKSGLAGMAITDHLDIGTPQLKGEFRFDPGAQQAEIERLDALYPIEIFKGVEVGLQPETLQSTREFLSPYRFDCVIASLHFVDGQDPYYGAYYENKTYRQAYARAFELMYDMAVEYRDFDILGHFDYIARYAPYQVRDITYREFGDLLDPLLRFLATEGKALEVNTNTYRERNGHVPVLDTQILLRFRELGGEAVSLGSDAHDTFRIGENFERYKDIIGNCGFRYLAYYKNRQPVFYPIG